MKRVAACLLVIASCGGSDSNPDTLWLAPKNGEQEVQLVDTEPNPY